MSPEKSLTALHRRHPELFALANTVIDRACNHAGHAQALWFVDGRWRCGPLDGMHYHRRGPRSVVAGVYTCTAQPAQIVLDMLAAQSEIMAAA